MLRFERGIGNIHLLNRHKMQEGQFNQFLRSKKLGEDTIKKYNLCHRWFVKLIGEQGISPETITLFLTQHTSNITRGYLVNLFEWQDIHYKLPKRTGRVKVKKRRTLTTEEIRRLSLGFDALGVKWSLIFEISYLLALRRMEILNIRIKDLDLEEWTNNAERPLKILIKGKGKKERMAVIPSTLAKKLIQYIQEVEFENTNQRIFPYSTALWSRKFKQVADYLLDYPFATHDLRRSKATKWYQKGVSPERIQIRLGHSNVDTTMRYLNIDEEAEIEKWMDEY